MMADFADESFATGRVVYLPHENGTDFYAAFVSQNPFNTSWYVLMLYIFFYATMTFVAVVGNVCLIMVVARDKSLHTITNCFVVNLSVSDALLALFNGLFLMFYQVSNDWFYGETLCLVSSFLSPCLISVEVFTHAAIAIDRFVALVHPLKPKIPSATIIAIVALTWLFAAALGFPNGYYAVLFVVPYSDYDRWVCTTVWLEDFSHDVCSTIFCDYNKLYKLILMVVNYFFPVILIVGAYSRICMVLWCSSVIGERTANTSEQIRTKRKVVKTLLLASVIFCTCWLPMHTYQLLVLMDETLADWWGVRYIHLAAYWIAISSTMYTPIIYFRMNSRYILSYITKAV